MRPVAKSEEAMTPGKYNPLGRILIACIPAALCACAPEPAEVVVAEPAAPEPAPLMQRYVSSKRVSTDCGAEFTPGAVPGFAEAAGVEIRDMPPPIADNMSVGADRPVAGTDPSRVSPGYVVIEPGFNKESYIINNDKEVIATLETDYIVGFSEILPDGNRLTSTHTWSNLFRQGGGNRGCLEEYAPDGSLVWRLNLSTDQYIHHHDMYKLPNGNILAVVWENVSTDEAISLGRDPEKVAENGQFWFDGIIEIDPYAVEIVWEWSARHHLVQEFDPGMRNYGVVAEHPELLDINQIQPSQDGTIAADWTHVNAMDYNEELDQIIFSSNYLSEVYVIDHSTTPQESAGHSGGRYGRGGDILYRWGHPMRYGRGTEDDRTLFNQHDVQWIREGLNGAGNILVFNNGNSKVRPYSTVVEIAPEMNADGSYVLRDGEAYGPESLVWEYNPEPPERFFSFFISGAQRLPNGNTLVTQGAGARVREVTPEGEIVWEYEYTSDIDAPHMLFRANRYPPDHPGIVKILSQ
jgi:hypothetical protein